MYFNKKIYTVSNDSNNRMQTIKKLNIFSKLSS